MTQNPSANITMQEALQPQMVIKNMSARRRHVAEPLELPLNWSLVSITARVITGM